MFGIAEKQRLRNEMLLAYLIKQIALTMSDEEIHRVNSLPHEENQRECARLENLASEVERRLGRQRLEEMVDDYYRRLEATGGLKRDIPAYKAYFDYIDCAAENSI